jgi:hypothetical protein
VAAQTGLTIIKSFTYRGETEEWSNQYWFNSGLPVPSGEGAWRSLFDQIVGFESSVYTSRVHVVGGYGYDDNIDDANAVWGVDLRQPPNVTVPGLLPAGTTTDHPGDAAVWAAWRTGRRNTDGKPIYLRKYFHDARDSADAAGDAIDPAQASALDTFADALGSGAIGFHVAARGHPEEVILARSVSAWVTTRTLKRRGKRPKAATPST